MKKVNLNLFKIIRENESVYDERINKEKVSIECYMFALVRITFACLITLELLPVLNKEIAHTILYHVFLFVIWIEPLIFSIRGLWENVRLAIVSVSAGCIITFSAVMKILLLILPFNIYRGIFIIIIGFTFTIINYLLCSITYTNYIKKQDNE